MSPYEREVVKRIYPLACDGDRKAIKILANLTTKARKSKKCPICGIPIKPHDSDLKQIHCSTKCYQFSRHRKKITESFTSQTHP